MTIVDATTTHHFDAILFDMDGTLVDSTAAVVAAWHKFADKYSLDVEKVLHSSHGVRTVDNMRIHCGITDDEEVEREAERFELAILQSAREVPGKGIVPLPGAIENTGHLEGGARRPNAVWALCTSATRAYASEALRIAGVSPPEIFVSAEDVTQGKPAPDPYLLGAKMVGADPSKCLVIEDAPAGIISGLAAGCKTMGVVTSHTLEQVAAVKPDYLVKNLASVTMALCKNGGVDVTIHGEQLTLPN